MKERGNTIKNLVIAIGVLAALGVVGYMYITRDASVDADLLVVESADQSVGVDGDLLRALQELRTIKLDTTIFNDQVFRSFIDFGTVLTPQQTGRDNPFAPISGSVGVTPSAGQPSSFSQ